MGRLRSVGLMLTIVLASCGGGGGEGEPQPLPDQSMIPAAPAPGAVLVAQAADLRPLRDGAQWSYRGVHRPGGGAIDFYYPTTVRQRVNAGVLEESGEGVFATTSIPIAVTVTAGTVSTQALGADDAMPVTELRSPVRAGDQYTQYEGNGLALGVDIDGDGKEDLADLAIYTTVVDQESVTLPELARAVVAVRVDTVTLLRVRLSSDGKALPISKVVQSKWYSVGIGIVRRALTAMSAGGTGPIEYDEILHAWDGVTEGLGAIGPTPAYLPREDASPARLMPGVISAAVVGDRALAVTGALRPESPDALTIAVLDGHGKVLSVREHAGLMQAPMNANPCLHALDDATALLAMPVPAAHYGMNDLRLQRVDASGALVGDPSTLQIGALTDIVSAWDGQSLWLGWRAAPDSYRTELMLQRYDADGKALSEPMILDSAEYGVVGTVRMAAANGRLLVTWVRAVSHDASYRYAVLDAAVQSPVVNVMGGGRLRNGYVEGDRPVMPTMSNGVAALYWHGPILSFTDEGLLPETRVRGVTLDAQWKPRRSTSGSLDEELLPTAWTAPDRRAVIAANGDQLVVIGEVDDRQIPELPSPEHFVLGSFLQPGNQALAATGASAVTLQGEVGNPSNMNMFGQASQVLLWGDRALVLGNDWDRTTTTLFWLH